MIINFDKYKIRDFKDTDVKSLVKYANNKSVSKFLRDSFPYPYNEKNALQWINFIQHSKSEYAFAIASNIEVIGSIGIVPDRDVHRFNAEIGFWLGEPFWNKGIISKALKVFTKYVFSEFDFNKLTANVFEGNDASKIVLEKTGFRLEGTLRKSVFKANSFYDLYIYGLLKEDFQYD